jgi:hypothetical protein
MKNNLAVLNLKKKVSSSGTTNQVFMFFPPCPQPILNQPLWPIGLQTWKHIKEQEIALPGVSGPQNPFWIKDAGGTLIEW